MTAPGALARTVNRLRGSVTLIFIAHNIPEGLAVDAVARIGTLPNTALEGGRGVTLHQGQHGAHVQRRVAPVAHALAERLRGAAPGSVMKSVRRNSQAQKTAGRARAVRASPWRRA